MAMNICNAICVASPARSSKPATSGLRRSASAIRSSNTTSKPSPSALRKSWRAPWFSSLTGCLLHLDVRVLDQLAPAVFLLPDIAIELFRRAANHDEAFVCLELLEAAGLNGLC